MVDAEEPQLCIVRVQARAFGGRTLTAESGTGSCGICSFSAGQMRAS
jgi:hypothetical protein